MEPKIQLKIIQGTTNKNNYNPKDKKNILNFIGIKISLDLVLEIDKQAFFYTSIQNWVFHKLLFSNFIISITIQCDIKIQDGVVIGCLPCRILSTNARRKWTKFIYDVSILFIFIFGWHANVLCDYRNRNDQQKMVWKNICLGFFFLCYITECVWSIINVGVV